MMLVLWFTVVDPRSITSDNVTQKGVTILMVSVQKALTDVQMVTSMPFCELFRNPTCRNFVKVKSVVDDFIGRTMSSLQ
jgi:hypothetical protein